MDSCYNCGLPANCCATEGVKVVLRLRPENRFKGERKQTVWCHNEECAIQSLAVARYGPATHKWPITLAQFRATNPLSNVTKSTSQSVDSTSPKSADFGIMDPEYQKGVFVTQNGRPRNPNALTDAQRAKAYRERQKQESGGSLNRAAQFYEN
jgi:hypothetical protein